MRTRQLGLELAPPRVVLHEPLLHHRFERDGEAPTLHDDVERARASGRRRRPSPGRRRPPCEDGAVVDDGGRERPATAAPLTSSTAVSAPRRPRIPRRTATRAATRSSSVTACCVCSTIVVCPCRLPRAPTGLSGQLVSAPGSDLDRGRRPVPSGARVPCGPRARSDRRTRSIPRPCAPTSTCARSSTVRRRGRPDACSGIVARRRPRRAHALGPCLDEVAYEGRSVVRPRATNASERLLNTITRTSLAFLGGALILTALLRRRATPRARGRASRSAVPSSPPRCSSAGSSTDRDDPTIAASRSTATRAVTRPSGCRSRSVS